MKAVGKLVYTQRGEPEREFELTAGSVTLGRGATNEIVLGDPKVSRVHARVECGDAGCTLVDLGSANGTRVNGDKVERTTLQPGDVIALGDSTLRFEAALPDSAPEMTRIQSAADLNATLMQTAVPIALPDTRTPHVVVHTPGRTWRVPLDQEVVTIGRTTENAVDLEFPPVSRHHARIERRGATFLLRDLNSRNGTWVGGQRVEEHLLQNGDTIRIGPAQLVFKAPFESEDLTVVEMPKAAGTRRRPPVVLVPGLLGSELWQGNTRVWPNVRLMFSQPEIFRLPEKEPLEARGLIREVVIVPNLIKLDQYNRFADFLEEALGYARDQDLFEFAYDWRQDVRESAKKLAEAIERWGLKPPIVLAGHSLGCLVCRYYVERLGGKQKVGRLLLLGSMNSGEPKVLTALLAGPNLLPFGLLGEKLREVLASFPSLYQALPTYACTVDQAGNGIDLMQDDTWLPAAQRPLLRRAQEFRHELGTRSGVPTVSIFGYGIKTITSAKIERESGGVCRKLDITVEPKGDDSIPEQSGVLEGTEIHPVQQYHGSLYVDNDVKMRLKMELMRIIE